MPFAAIFAAAFFAQWILPTGFAFAQSSDARDLPEQTETYADDLKDFPVKLGDTYERVKVIFATELAPIPFTGFSGGTMLHLKTKGLWFFFATDGKIRTIRFEAPYPNRIGGVRIGDSLDILQSVRGKPFRIVNSISPLLPRGFVYHLDDVNTVNYHVNSKNVVETIFWAK